ncbi:MAG: glycosyltransferase family 39 protein [Ruminococcaceae bacterium]|nr:glycosyltransferase family 39 protein [Oscillospiraceae bacterium]
MKSDMFTAKGSAQTGSRQFFIFLTFTAALVLVLVCALHTRTLPFAEGWYTYYAKCINQGLLPYRDFEYLYPPVYIYTVALLTKIFGYDLIVLRRLGILFFTLIAVGLYLCAVEIVGKKRSYIAMIAAVCGAFYLQSEVVQTFYDYVRMMDVFAIFSLYFLLRAAKRMCAGLPCRKALFWCGVLCGIFINIKQNIGLIFFAYALILTIYLGIWCKKTKKSILCDVTLLCLPPLLILALIAIALLQSGSLVAYLNMTGAAAAGAKGGIYAILFGWLFHNGTAFLHALPVALLFLFVIVGAFVWLRLLSKQAPHSTQPKHNYTTETGLIFFLLLSPSLFAVLLFEPLGRWLLPTAFLSTYAIFLTVTPIFAACGVWGILDMRRGTDTMRDVMPFFVLSGAYFAISFGCGNSGGLAEGQASFGVIFLICALLFLCESYLKIFHHRAKAATGILLARGGTVLLCLLLALCSADKKLVYTYNWWGMTAASFWESTAPLDLPHTQGLAVSPQTKAVYEEIVHAITAHTAESDPIFCFPQIPIFYVLTNRPDPGTFTKVQWFDVASDDAVLGDIELIQKDPPKAILIYHTGEYAYTSHEQAFRGGNASGTRIMRDFLLSFVKTEGYRLHGTYQTGENTLTLWLAL